MLRVIPEDEHERKEDIRFDLKRRITKSAMRHGVPWELVEDSESINSSIESIVFSINRMHEMIKDHGTTTSMTAYDEQEFKPIPGYRNETFDSMMEDSRKFKKTMDEHEKRKVKKGGKKE